MRGVFYFRRQAFRLATHRQNLTTFWSIPVTLIRNTLAALSIALLAVVLLAPTAGMESVLVARLQERLLPVSAVLLLAAALAALVAARVRFLPFELVSRVNGHAGSCAPIWVNRNQVDYMLTGATTGFFRRAVRLGKLPFVFLTGPEFHGYLRDHEVLSTEGAFGRLA